LDVDESAVGGVYAVPVSVSYRTSEFGSVLSVSRVVSLVVEERVGDPFGSLSVVSSPSVLVPGLRGVELRLSLPYLGGLVERLYDVSLSLGLVSPFSSVNGSSYLGVMSAGSSAVAVFYLDVAEGAVSGEYDVPVSVRYRLDQAGEFRVASKVAKLFVVSEEADPFGSLGVATVPSVLVPGLRGVELRLSLPYLGGLVERLYDVSLLLGLESPLSSVNGSYELGVVSPQSPIGPTPVAVFYLELSTEPGQRPEGGSEIPQGGGCRAGTDLGYPEPGGEAQARLKRDGVNTP
jgi:hypothetical protein